MKTKYLRPILLILFSITIVVYIYTIFTRQNTFDDAYMFIRYAFNLDEYGVIGWNSNERTYGCTSFGYLLSTYLFIKLGILKILTQSQFLVVQSYIYFLLSLFIIYLIIKTQLYSFKYNIELFLIIACYLSFIPIFRFNIVFGMDTTMSFFSNLLLIYFVLNYDKSNLNLFLIPFLAYFTFFVRPDNIIFSFLFSFLYLYNKILNKKLIFLILIALSLFTLDTILKVNYFGYILPLSYYVKTSIFYKLYLGNYNFDSFQYLSEVILYLSPFILIIINLFKITNFKFLLSFLFPFILTNLYLLQTTQIMGYASRLLIPSTAFLITLSIILLKMDSNIFDYFKNKIKMFLTFLIIVFFVFSIKLFGKYFNSNEEDLIKIEASKYVFNYNDSTVYKDYSWFQNISRMKNLIEEIDSPNLVFAGSEHGYISSFNKNNVILCLAGLHNNNTYIYKNLSDNVLDISIIEYNPDLIWMPHFHYVGLRFDILNSNYFRDNYDFYQGLYEYGIAIRKNSEYYNQIIDIARNDHNINKLTPTKYSIYYEEK